MSVKDGLWYFSIPSLCFPLMMAFYEWGYIWGKLALSNLHCIRLHHKYSSPLHYNQYYYEVVFRDTLIAMAFKLLFISDDGWRNMRLEQNQDKDKGSFDVSLQSAKSGYGKFICLVMHHMHFICRWSKVHIGEFGYLTIKPYNGVPTHRGIHHTSKESFGACLWFDQWIISE